MAEIMPILANPRHEAFAQARAKLVPADAAYVEAGYKYDRGNAIRLTAKDSVAARIAELQKGSVTATTLTVTRRREICAGIAEDQDVDPHVRIAATLAEARHAGELIEKAELKVKQAPSQEDMAAAVQATLARRGLVPGRS